MLYHILEVQKIDKDGNIISHQFFIVDAGGVVLPGPSGGPFATLGQAIATINFLVEEDKRNDSVVELENNSSQTFKM